MVLINNTLFNVSFFHQWAVFNMADLRLQVWKKNDSYFTGLSACVLLRQTDVV